MIFKGGKKLNNNNINSQSKIKRNTKIDSKGDNGIYYDGIGDWFRQWMN